MKTFVTFLIVVIIAEGSGCKKNRSSHLSNGIPLKEMKITVSTAAGQGAPTFVNGPAITATFHYPEDVAISPEGAVYVTDVLNFCIRKLLNGQVSTFAGGGGIGIVNANGLNARFKNPYSITSDALGNLYTSDESDPRIRKISPAGDVTTYAGLEVAGFANGDTDTAKFGLGNSIISDEQGNVYVADAINNRIRKISVAGKVTTIAGSGEFGFKEGDGTAAKFASPGGIAIDKNNNLYVVDRGNFRIRKITPAGRVSTIAGGMEGEQDGNAGEAQFSNDMHDVVVDHLGNLYVEDENRIRKITPQGTVSTISGTTGFGGYHDGNGATALFNFPAGMGIDAQGNLYVADLINNRIRIIGYK